MRTLTEFPLFVLLAMIGAAAMLVPALHAVQLEQWKIARTFLYHGIFFFMFASIIGVATMNRAPRLTAKAHLLTLFLSYLLFPAMLAAPVLQLVPSLAFGQGYFEMLANLTTTGGTVFERPGELAQPLQLWSALVGWMGGFLILMAALAVLEPMNLGGFEIRSVVMRSGSGTVRSTDASKEATERIIRVSRGLAGPYVVLTGVLALLLILLGDRPFVAVSHAMAVLATNGTSPVGGITGASSGIPGEMVVAVFLFFAVSHWLFRFDFSRDQIRALRRDPEILLGVNIVALVAVALFLRHWFAAFEVEEEQNVTAALRAFWGSFFTAFSFLTTLGFESADWSTSRSWSGLGTPGLVLLGLAMLGGGVATTAGGVKLLRVFALYKHGMREMNRLVHPSAVAGAGSSARRFRREGAQLAWVFLMLFLLSVAALMLLLSAAGIGFEASLALAVSSVTNTGPAAALVDTGSTNYANLAAFPRYVLCAAMILGRMETLAVIALLNPDYWR